MMRRTGATFAAMTLALAGCSRERAAPITITGSSTVYPFTKAVGDRLAEAGTAPAPTIEPVGTVAGIKTFCAGRGAPDILDASRRINRREFMACQANKVGEVLEIPIGLDKIALAESNAGPRLSITSKDLYLALAANPMGKPNTAKRWSDVDPKLPAIPIKLIGPPASSGTRDAFVTLIMEPGCIEAMPAAAALRASGDPAKFDLACRQLRTDGPYVTGTEDYGATANALEQDGQAVGLFGYSYLERSAGRLHGVPINGIAPDAAAGTGAAYPGARPLYLYVKKRHMKKKPAIQAFLNLYAAMWKPGGELAKAGLIAMSDSMARRSLDTVTNGYPLDAADLP